MDPIQIALVLLILGLSPENFENWKSRSRADLRDFSDPSKNKTVSSAYCCKQIFPLF